MLTLVNLEPCEVVGVVGGGGGVVLVLVLVQRGLC